MAGECQYHENHEHHMCQLVLNATPTDELKELVRNAEYICDICGRTAAKDENLCAPQKL